VSCRTGRGLLVPPRFASSTTEIGGLVEGFWSTGAGLHAADVEEMVAPLARSLIAETLGREDLWGRPVHDERYLITAWS
jgi:hypothetical protein